ncbi:hypothetical protein AcV7_002071 [Taiwanofungus camphoratus]|nr:hypothetical protein AcV7_002071 [Antrodia cinnamomea]
MAVRDTIDIPELYTNPEDHAGGDEDYSAPSLYGAIEVSAAAFKHALSLWTSGDIVLEKGEHVLQQKMNFTSGKTSFKSSGFGETKWGKKTSDFRVSALELLAVKLEKIKEVHKSMFMMLWIVLDHQKSNLKTIKTYSKTI